MEDPILKSFLKKIRKTMPEQIARELASVQSIYDPLYAEHEMNKEQYQHFTRIYNRKKHQKISTLIDAGYKCYKVSGGFIEPRKWCEKTFRPGSYIAHLNHFIFAYDQDYTLFVLRWGSQ